MTRTSSRRTPAAAATARVLAAATLLLAAGCLRPDGKTPDADPIATGWRTYRLGEFRSSARSFEEALAGFPEGSDTHLAALYGLGNVWAWRTPLPDQDKGKAEAYLRRLLELSPEHDLAAWSALTLARMKHIVPVGQEPDYGAARAAYREVVDRYPEHLAGQEAFIYLQSTYVAEMAAEPARHAERELLAFIEKYGSSGFVQLAYSLLATCYEVLDEPEKRLQAQLDAFRTQEVDPTNPRQENSWPYWRIATLAEFDVGDLETARTFYRRLIDEYPKDIRRYAAETALKRMDELENRLRSEQ